MTRHGMLCVHEERSAHEIDTLRCMKYSAYGCDDSEAEAGGMGVVPSKFCFLSIVV
jgi:hypothetical protein